MLWDVLNETTKPFRRASTVFHSPVEVRLLFPRYKPTYIITIVLSYTLTVINKLRKHVDTTVLDPSFSNLPHLSTFFVPCQVSKGFVRAMEPVTLKREVGCCEQLPQHSVKQCHKTPSDIFVHYSQEVTAHSWCTPVHGSGQWCVLPERPCLPPPPWPCCFQCH